jgi:hypothetical protein
MAGNAIATNDTSPRIAAAPNHQIPVSLKNLQHANAIRTSVTPGKSDPKAWKLS